MNSSFAFLFATLLVIYISFALLLFIISMVQGKKGLFYMYVSFFLRAIHMAGPALLMTDLNISWSAYLTGPVKVTLIPVTYLYIKKLSSSQKRLSRDDLWHFIPLFANLILTLIIVPGHANEIVGKSSEALSSSFKMVWDDNFYHNVLAIPCRIISFLQAILYSFLVYRLYKKYIQAIINNISLLSHYNVIWIKWVVIIILLQGFFEGFALLGIYHLPFMFLLAFLFSLLYAFFFFIHALMQEDLFLITDVSEKLPDPEEIQKENDETKKILKSFRKKEIYLAPDISLQEVANQLKISKNKLTKIIKEAGYDNFYTFINYHRINKSKILLSEMPNNYVIESIVQQSGFKARSTFYRVFKEITGETPSEHIRKYEMKKNSLERTLPKT